MGSCVSFQIKVQILTFYTDVCTAPNSSTLNVNLFLADYHISLVYAISSKSYSLVDVFFHSSCFQTLRLPGFFNVLINFVITHMFLPVTWCTGISHEWQCMRELRLPFGRYVYSSWIFRCALLSFKTYCKFSWEWAMQETNKIGLINVTQSMLIQVSINY